MKVSASDQCVDLICVLDGDDNLADYKRARKLLYGRTRSVTSSKGRFQLL